MHLTAGTGKKPFAPAAVNGFLKPFGSLDSRVPKTPDNRMCRAVDLSAAIRHEKNCLLLFAPHD